MSVATSSGTTSAAHARCQGRREVARLVGVRQEDALRLFGVDYLSEREDEAVRGVVLQRRVDAGVSMLESFFASITIAEVIGDPDASKPLCEVAAGVTGSSASTPATGTPLPRRRCTIRKRRSKVSERWACRM